MAPPVRKRSTSTDPSDKAVATPARKRAASTDPSSDKRPSIQSRRKTTVVEKQPTRLPSRAAIEAAAVAKRRNEAQQTSIAFNAVEKHSIGMKLLLDAKIYLTPSLVRFKVFVVVVFLFFLLTFCSTYSLFDRYQIKPVVTCSSIRSTKFVDWVQQSSI